MRFILATVWFLALWLSNAVAQPLTNFPLASFPLSGAEYFNVVQSGLSKKITIGQLGLPLPANITSVLAWGAKCDGQTDDSGAFAKAIASLDAPNLAGGVVLVPATGHSCRLAHGVTVSSASQSGITVQGVAGLYWPGPYDNVEADWTQFGSWIKCDDQTTTCLSVLGDGSRIDGLNFWYNQPTPPANTGCGAFCNMTHNWAPIEYPYTITVSSPQNFNHLSNINIINASKCIDVEGGATGVATIFSSFEHLYLGCFDVGTRWNQVDNGTDIHDANYTLWWFPFSSDVIGYTEGDSTHNGHKIDWDASYLADIHAEGIEFYQSRTAIRVTDACVTSGLGQVCFGGQAWMMTNINFNQVCEAVELAASDTHFNGTFSNIALNVDPQTSNATQCAGYLPNAFNINSNNVNLTISDLNALFVQTIANIGSGTGGILRMRGLKMDNYSAFFNNSPAFNINTGGVLDMPSDLNALFAVTPANAGPHFTGTPNWPTTMTELALEGTAGVIRQIHFEDLTGTAAPSVNRWTFTMAADASMNIQRFASNGAPLDVPIIIPNTNAKPVFFTAGIAGNFPSTCSGATTGTVAATGAGGALVPCP